MMDNQKNKRILWIFDVIQWDKLNRKQINIVLSLKEWFSTYDWLTNKQYELLEDIYRESQARQGDKNIMSNMYKDTKTWNPAVGCLYNCIYCFPTFRAALKRRKHACMDCYNYVPHTHPERLNKIPSAKNIFVCGDGDISFCPPEYTRQIIETIKEHNYRIGLWGFDCEKNKWFPRKTFYFQSKNPFYFKQFLPDFPPNVILLTTLETDISEGYRNISQAPFPLQRAKDFIELDYPRKAVTIEPIMDFDLHIFLRCIRTINPEFVYIGFNSRPKAVQLPEPPIEKVKKFINELKKFTEVKGKDLRSLFLAKLLRI